MVELTNEQLKRQDFVDNAIFEMIKSINPVQKEIEWNIEMIGEIRDCIERWIVETLQVADRMTFYPYVE